MPNLFVYKYSVLFQTIQFSISTQFVKNISIKLFSFMAGCLGLWHVGYLMPNPFLNKLVLFQTSLAWVHSLIVKNISISSYSV